MEAERCHGFAHTLHDFQILGIELVFERRMLCISLDQCRLRKDRLGMESRLRGIVEIRRSKINGSVLVNKLLIFTESLVGILQHLPVAVILRALRIIRDHEINGILTGIHTVAHTRHSGLIKRLLLGGREHTVSGNVITHLLE